VENFEDSKINYPEFISGFRITICSLEIKELEID